MDKVSYRPNNLPQRVVKKTVLPNVFGNIFVKLIFVGISVFLLYNVGHSIYITVLKVNILKEARTEVEKLRVTNLELDTELQNMQTPEYIEIEARDRLNFSGKKDVVFVIPDTLMSSAKERLDRILDTTSTVDKKTVMEQWKEFILRGV